jgi:hypothetical protein
MTSTKPLAWYYFVILMHLHLTYRRRAIYMIVYCCHVYTALLKNTRMPVFCASGWAPGGPSSCGLLARAGTMPNNATPASSRRALECSTLEDDEGTKMLKHAFPGGGYATV